MSREDGISLICRDDDAKSAYELRGSGRNHDLARAINRCSSAAGAGQVKVNMMGLVTEDNIHNGDIRLRILMSTQKLSIRIAILCYSSTVLQQYCVTVVLCYNNNVEQLLYSTVVLLNSKTVVP